MHDPLQRIIKLQTIVAAIIAASIGIALMIFDQQASQSPDMQWLGFFPWSEVGGTLLVAAVLGLGLDYFTNKDKEAADTERLRRVLQESAPAMRDAVIDGFAFGHDDLARVSNPDVLDNVVRNSLALRIGDAELRRRGLQRHPRSSRAGAGTLARRQGRNPALTSRYT